MTRTATIHAQQKWEYHELTKWAERAFVNELNVLGKEGWELVSALHYTDVKGAVCWTGILKRPCVGAPAPPEAQPAAAPVQPAKPAAQVAEKPAAALSGFDLSDGDFKLAAE
jgi:hypothetical protein